MKSGFTLNCRFITSPLSIILAIDICIAIHNNRAAQAMVALFIMVVSIILWFIRKGKLMKWDKVPPSRQNRGGKRPPNPPNQPKVRSTFPGPIILKEYNGKSR